jgi:hypothetical protein
MDEAGRQHAMTRMEPVAPPATLLYAIASTISLAAAEELSSPTEDNSIYILQITNLQL